VVAPVKPRKIQVFKMKITKSQLKQIIQEELGGMPDKKAAMDELLTVLFKVRTQAKSLEQWDVAGHVDEAINLLELSISSGT